jgi:pimeloyl-ACP methyl ester carboxylesterase
VWLCQPATTDDPCDVPVAASAVHADGSATPVPAPAVQQPVDCFYVYPTVSQAPTLNAPLRATAVEKRTATAQVARFSSVCRVFAPVYRQLTVHALLTGGFGNAKGRALSHADVVSAWHDYLRHNPGRRFVLIGHSQGSFELLSLMQDELDRQPALRDRLVSALLLGGNVKVPPGKDVGGDLKSIALCRGPSQHGCVVTYNSYDATPPSTALFGRPDANRGLVAACTNPAALSGGTGSLSPYFPGPALSAGLPTFAANDRVTTPWASYPDYLTAQCLDQDGAAWLQVAVHPALGDTRPTSLPKTLGPDWGLHLLDVNLALGNLVDLVRTESG